MDLSNLRKSASEATSQSQNPALSLSVSQRRFNTADTFVRCAWGLHLGAGFLLLIVGSVLPNEKALVPLYHFLAATGNSVFPILQSAKNCNYVGLLSQAIGAVIFFTGQVLIFCYIVKHFLHAFLPDVNVYPKLKYSEILFWMPMSVVVGVGMYWVTYIEVANATHIICASNATRTWMFRLAPTIATPFVVVMTLAPIFTFVYFLISKFKKFKGV